MKRAIIVVLVTLAACDVLFNRSEFLFTFLFWITPGVKLKFIG